MRDGVEELVCKVGTPWVTTSSSFIGENPNEQDEKKRKMIKFWPVRNDPLMSNTPLKHIRKWRANTDMQPVVDMQNLLNYLCKYCTKPEIPSTALLDMIGILEKYDEAEGSRGVAKLYTKSINKCHARDYCAQEVAHHLLKLHGYHCSQ